MAGITIEEERCKGCGLCMTACPGKLIRMSSEFNSAGLHPALFEPREKCTGCGFCYIMCPDTAIEVWK